MKILVATFLLLSALSKYAQSSSPNLISLHLDYVEVVNAVRMIEHIAGVSLIHTPDVLQLAGRISVNIQSKPWNPVLSEILAAKGFVLIPVRDSANTYRIDKVDSASSAALYRAADASVQVIDSVLEALTNGDLNSAKTELTKHKEENLQLMQSLKPTKTAIGMEQLLTTRGGSLPLPAKLQICGMLDMPKR